MTVRARRQTWTRLLAGLVLGYAAGAAALVAQAAAEVRVSESRLEAPAQRVERDASLRAADIQLPTPTRAARIRPITPLAPADLARRAASVREASLGLSRTAERPCARRPASCRRFARHWPRSDCDEPDSAPALAA